MRAAVIRARLPHRLPLRVVGAAMASTIAIAGALACPPEAHATEADELPMTPAAIVEGPADTDGTTVTIRGEAIGEDLRADADHRWVNVLGGGAAVGVYMTDELAERITTYGDHKHMGDVIDIDGVLNRACPQHAGEFDIHAEDVRLVEAGFARETPLRPWKALVGLALMAVAFGEYRLFKTLRDRRPK